MSLALGHQAAAWCQWLVNLSDCREAAGLSCFSVPLKKDFCLFLALSSGRAALHGVMLPPALSVGFAALCCSQLPHFPAVLPSVFFHFPLCFLPIAEVAECHVPTEAGFIHGFGHFIPFLSSKANSPYTTPSVLQYRTVLFGGYNCLWEIIATFLCGLCINPLHSAN